MKYFKIEEFNCKETGENDMNLNFLVRLDLLREVCGFPFIVISGFRSVKHSVEKRKKVPGQHPKGVAADIKINGGVQRRLLVKNALLMGFTGIGVGRNIIHVDDRITTPVMWVY